YSGYSNAFLSALSVEITHNQQPSAMDHANDSGAPMVASVLGLAHDLLSTSKAFVDLATAQSRNVKPPSGGDVAFSVANLAMTATNLVIEHSGLRAEEVAKRQMSLMMFSTMLQGANQLFSLAEAGVEAAAGTVAGYLNLADSGLGILGAYASTIISS